jgi:uncharacterized protein
LSVDEKTRRLEGLLHEYRRVAVAFSGGTDSSFLLCSALRVLGAGNVLPLFAVSELVAGHDVNQALSWPDRNGFAGLEIEQVDLRPLSWKEFVSNSKRRCYFCKLRMYQEFLACMHDRDFSFLLDGTNLDDLKDSRPGLQAIHELGVKIPLVEAGFTKAEIRETSRKLGLDTWDRQSGSCLATRIPHDRAITDDSLRAIEKFEETLQAFGFAGCRVRLHESDDATIYIQVARDDIEKITSPAMRLAVNRFFQKAGIRRVFLDLGGR